MTRETKIGLLVGLAFIIVIGILLSEQLNRSTEAPPAPISVVGDNVRSTVAPAPTAAVPTNADLTAKPAPSAVVVLAQTPVSSPSQAQRSDAAPAAAPGQVVPLPQHTDAAPAAAAGPRPYVAQPGDSLSRIAARQLGADTTANRNAIIRANPTLADDPDMIIAGRTYMIPGATASAVSPRGAAERSTASTASAQPTHTYTVKKGDTLWRIAVQQLGSSAAVAAIEDLNKAVLKGSTTLHEGTQLRLPAKSIASAT